MSLWIQIDTKRSSNHKTDDLAGLLSAGGGDLFAGRDDAAWRAIGIALLDEFWSYVAEQFPDGEVSNARPLTLRRALAEWLAGTEWARKDPRELLLKSGHVDKRADGRLFVHDWMEWTGGSVLKLAKERKRKRLARARDVRTRPRKRGAGVRGQSEPGPVLAVQCSAVQSSPVLSSPKAAAAGALDYVTRCIIAVNQVLSERMAGAYRALTAAEHGDAATAWEAAGIPVGLAERVLAERASDYRATPLNRQPHTLRYFDAAVREAHSKVLALGAGGPVSPGDRARARADELEREAAK